jgi:methylmalonyl-CoA mutase cobalamin-binding domain/chain
MSDANQALEALKQSIIDGKKDIAVAMAQEAIDKGVRPEIILNDYMIAALQTVGKLFEAREIFVPEMMISAKAMKAALEIVKPLLPRETSKKKGTVVIGTIQGDLHDIGKNLVGLMLDNAGYNVVDLGVNVSAARFVDEAIKNEADVIGLSSLLTTGDPYIKSTVATIRSSQVPQKVKIICGGAAVTDKLVKLSGADRYVPDAANAVPAVQELLTA